MKSLYELEPGTPVVVRLYKVGRQYFVGGTDVPAIVVAQSSQGPIVRHRGGMSLCNEKNWVGVGTPTPQRPEDTGRLT
jgi:hypothetical protein